MNGLCPLKNLSLVRRAFKETVGKTKTPFLNLVPVFPEYAIQIHDC